MQWYMPHYPTALLHVIRALMGTNFFYGNLGSLHGRNRQHDWQRRLGRLGWLGRVPRPLRARLQPRALPWRWHRPPRPHCRHLDGVLALACSHCLCLRHGRSHCTCDGLVDGRLRVRLRCSRHCLGHLSCRRGRTTSATSCRRASSLSRESLCCSRRCCSRSCSICARLAARLAACSRRSAASSAAACSRARHAASSFAVQAGSGTCAARSRQHGDGGVSDRGGDGRGGSDGGGDGCG